MPFEISREAEVWLSRLPVIEGHAPGFLCTPRYVVYRGDRIVEEFTVPHYGFVYATTDAWLTERAGISISVGNRVFWVTADTLDGMQGRILSVVESDVGKEQSIVRRFLVMRDPSSVSEAAIQERTQANRTKTAEPGATDNPDDAQRLREDY